MRAHTRGVLLLLAALGAPLVGHAAASEVAAVDHRGKERLLVLVFGDSGTGKPDQYEVGRRMAEECTRRGGCDLALMLGDNIYGGPLQAPRREGERLVFDPAFDARFERPYAPLGALEFWAVAGNHDWASAATIESEIAYTGHSPRWRMPDHDFSVPRLPEWIRVYGLDTSPIATGRELDQVQRAAAALCAGSGWKILFGHYPVYSSGWHADAHGEYSKASLELLAPLIERCGVHFYLSGHDHHQEHLSAAGFEQIIQGAAGKLRKVRAVERRTAGVVQRAAADLFGFALLEIGPRTLEVRFFGYGRERPYANWHCRAYALDDFADPTRRSRACGLDPPDQIK